MEGYWELFWRTGSPEVYLLYKREQEARAAGTETDAAEV